MHPVDVSAQRIDFAVMRDIAVRMRAFPAGKRIGAETRVNKRQSALHRLIGELGEKCLDLLRHEHAFIHNGTARETGDIKIMPAFDIRVANRILRAAPDDIKLSFKSQIVFDIRASADKDLANERF